MTNSPDPTSPASDSRTTTDAVAGSETETTDAGTYERILEPRSANRLPLGDGVWHQISRKYVTVQAIATGILVAIVIGAALTVWLTTAHWWPWIVAGVVVAGCGWRLAILPRQARAYGYQLRADDLVFRRGIVWQRLVAVPYGRMQLVDITHGPLDRGFGIAQLKLVTAAAATGVTIPGLGQEAAERLRDTLIAVAETRRTGL